MCGTVSGKGTENYRNTVYRRRAFENCTLLEKITIYDKIEYIADNAFEGCDKLTIYGIKGSYVEQYANEHNIPFEELDTTYEPTN